MSYECLVFSFSRFSLKGMALMANITRSQKKWQERLNASLTNGDYAAGIQGMRESPGAAANRNIEGYRNGVMQAIADGRVEAGNSSYSLQDYQKACLEKGKTNIATGVAKIDPRKLDNMARAQEAVSAIAEQVNMMPATTLEERIAKSAEQQRRAAQIRVKGRR